jgi:hypothetical protein
MLWKLGEIFQEIVMLYCIAGLKVGQIDPLIM